MHRYAELLDQGLTPTQIKRRVAAGELIALRRGIYLDRRAARTPEQRHRQLLQATRPQLADGAVFTHVTAAVLHGLPVPIQDLATVHITRVATGGRRTAHVHRHSAPLPDDVLAQVDGVTVTTIERTVVDMARWLTYEDGVAVVDAALRLGVARAALEREVERARRRSGNARARRAVVFGDGRAESPGESRSRVLIARLRLPLPALQREFRDRWGHVDARVDFDWEEFGVCGEFDGKVKYGRLLRPGQSVEEVVLLEKNREELLRTHGRWTIRWRYADLQDPGRFRHIIESGFRNGPRGTWPRP